MHAAETGHLVFGTLHTHRRARDHQPHRRLLRAPPAAQMRLQLGSVLARGGVAAARAARRRRAGWPRSRSCSNTGTVYECIVDATRTREIRDHIAQGPRQLRHADLRSGPLRADPAPARGSRPGGLRFAEQPRRSGAQARRASVTSRSRRDDLLILLGACGAHGPAKTTRARLRALRHPRRGHQPEADATDAYFRGAVEFRLTDPDPSATSRSTGVAGAASDARHARGQIEAFTPDAPSRRTRLHGDAHLVRRQREPHVHDLGGGAAAGGRPHAAGGST